MRRLWASVVGLWNKPVLLAIVLGALTVASVAVSTATSLGFQKTVFWAVLGAVVSVVLPLVSRRQAQVGATNNSPLSNQDYADMIAKHRDDLIGSVSRIIDPALKLLEGTSIPLRLLARTTPGLTLGVGANGSAKSVAKISEAFASAGDQMVLLGDPGSGKSVLLAELADSLLQSARAKTDAAVPVIIDLNGWQDRKPEFEDWMLRMLNRPAYGISPAFGRSLLQKEGIIPLVDGLDEIKDDGDRARCIEAINRFRNPNHGQMPMVVACRQEEYEAACRLAGERLTLRGEVAVQPLTKAEIVETLQKSGMAPLASLLDQDPTLLQLLSSHLFLTIVIETYQGKPTDAITSGTVEERTAHLVGDYVRARLALADGSVQRYPNDRTTAWLAWLARKLLTSADADKVFYYDLLQPTWLDRPPQRWLVTFGLAASLGLVTGAIAWFVYAQIFGSWALPLAAVASLTVALAAYDSGIAPTAKLAWSWQRWGGHALGWLTFGPIFGLVAGLVVGLVARLQGGLVAAVAVLVSGLIAGLCLGVFFALVSLLDTDTYRVPSGPGRAIETSRRNALFGGSVLAISAAVIAGVGGGAIVQLGLLPPNVRADLTAWLVPALIVQCVAFGLLIAGGLGWDPGIRLVQVGGRFRTGLIIGLGIGLVDAQVGLLMSGQWGWVGHVLSMRIGGGEHLKGIVAGILLAVLAGVGTGIVHGLLRGGGAYLRHGLLMRLLETDGGVAPRYLDFLAYAGRINLLQRKGGGYQFAYSPLLAHFAGAPIAAPSPPPPAR